MSRRSIEPCLCGDPECPRCFPGNRDQRDDGDLIDDAYERATQEKADDERDERAREREEERIERETFWRAFKGELT